MTDNMTSQNIELSSWDTLYIGYLIIAGTWNLWRLHLTLCFALINEHGVSILIFYGSTTPVGLDLLYLRFREHTQTLYTQ